MLHLPTDVRPDPRVGDRQRACGADDCQRRRRAQTQSCWRSRNPSYQMSYRLERRSAAVAAAERQGERDAGKPAELPPALRLPAELRSIPWDLAKTRLGFAGAELLAIVAITLVRLVHQVRAGPRGDMDNEPKDE